MTTGQIFGELWSPGARDWATFMEPHYQSLYEAVYDRLGIGDGTRLLDVGCGPGGAALLAAGRSAQVAGLDASPGSVKLARERVPAGDFRVGDMENLPWPDGSFDAVTGFNSFSFAANQAAALAQTRRVLKPRGKLGMVTFLPPEENQQTKILAAIAALAPPPILNGPGPFALSAPGVVESVLETVGFQLVGRGEFPVVLDYQTVEAACRAMLSSGGGVQAVRHSGEECVRRAVQEAVEPFRTETGSYRIQNRFWVMIADRPLGA